MAKIVQKEFVVTLYLDGRNKSEDQLEAASASELEAILYSSLVDEDTSIGDKKVVAIDVDIIRKAPISFNGKD